MNRAIAMLVIGLAFGFGLGFLLAAANGVTLDGHDHAADHGQAVAPDGEAAVHDHGETVDLAAGPAAPMLSATLLPDPVSGWNLHLETTNFVFAPEHSGHAHVEGEGHAHLYVNGDKIARLYGPWAHVEALPAGAQVEVTLTTNDHRALSVGGQPLAARLDLP